MTAGQKGLTDGYDRIVVGTTLFARQGDKVRDLGW